jgi:hypothetical protein
MEMDDTFPTSAAAQAPQPSAAHSSAPQRSWRDDPRIGTVQLPDELRVVGQRQADGTVGDGWYNINIGGESDPGKAYDDLEPVDRHHAYLVEVMQNVVDWCTLEVARHHRLARGGVFAFIDDERGLLGSSCIRKQVCLDVRVAGSSATIARASIDVRTPAGPQPLVEIVVDPSTRTVYMLQLGQGMIHAEDLLRIMSGTKDASSNLKLLPPSLTGSLKESLDVAAEPSKRPRLKENSEGAAAAASASASASAYADAEEEEEQKGDQQQVKSVPVPSPLDLHVPQGGRHGLGFKQLMVLLMKNENDHWRFTMRGSVTAPDASGHLVAAVHSLTPEWSDSKACVVMLGQTRPNQQVITDAAVLRLFRPEVQAIVKSNSKALLLQTLVAPPDVDGASLKRMLCFSHVLFRSPLPLSEHVAWSSRDVPHHRLHGGHLSDSKADDYVGFDFQRRYDGWREWSIRQAYKDAPPPLILNLHDQQAPSPDAASTSAAASAACSSGHEARALRIARLDPLLDAFQFGRKRVVLAVNGTPIKLLPSEDFGDVLIVTHDIAKFTATKRGKFTEPPDTNFFDSVLREVSYRVHGVEDESYLTPPLRWYLTLVARFFAQPSTHWAVLMRTKAQRLYELAALIARIQFWRFHSWFSAADVKKHEQDLQAVGLHIPKDKQFTEQDLLGDFYAWLMDPYQEWSGGFDDNFPTERRIRLSMRSVPEYVSRRVLRGVVAQEKMRPQPVELYLNDLGRRVKSADEAAAARDLSAFLDSSWEETARVEDDRRLFGVLRCFRTLAAFFTREQRWIGGAELQDQSTGERTMRLPSGEDIRVWILDAPARGCHVNNANLDSLNRYDPAFIFSPGYHRWARSFKQIRFVTGTTSTTTTKTTEETKHSGKGVKRGRNSKAAADAPPTAASSAAAAAAAAGTNERAEGVVCLFGGEVDLRHEAFCTPSHNIVIMLQPLREVLAACEPHAVIDHFIRHVVRYLPLQASVEGVLTPLLCWELNRWMSKGRESYKNQEDCSDEDFDFSAPFPLKISVHQRALLSFLRGCSNGKSTLTPNLNFSHLFPTAPMQSSFFAGASAPAAAAAAASASSDQGGAAARKNATGRYSLPAPARRPAPAAASAPRSATARRSAASESSEKEADGDCRMLGPL